MELLPTYHRKAACVLWSLCIGISCCATGAVTLGFLRFHKLHVLDHDRLVLIGKCCDRAISSGPFDPNLYSMKEYQELANAKLPLSGIAAVKSIDTESRASFRFDSVRVECWEATVREVTPSYFSLFIVRPALGTLFPTSKGAHPLGTPASVLVAYDTWQERLNADPAIIGKYIEAAGKSYRIAGVLPQGFSGETPGRPPDLWAALQPNTFEQHGVSNDSGISSHTLLVLGALPEEVRIPQLESEIEILFDADAGIGRSHNPIRVTAIPYGLLDYTSRAPCWNLVLLLIFGSGEAVYAFALAMRTRTFRALGLRHGGEKAPLIRRVLVSAVYVLIGSILCVALVQILRHFLLMTFGNVHIGDTGNPATTELAIAAMVVSVMCIAILQNLSRKHLAKDNADLPTKNDRIGIGTVFAITFLVALGVSGSVPYLVSLWTVLPGPLDINTNGLYQVILPINTPAAAKQLAAMELLENVRALSGCVALSFSSQELLGRNSEISSVSITGDILGRIVHQVNVQYDSPSYFDTLRLHLLVGVDPGSLKTAREGSAFVNQAFAREYFGGFLPLGTTLFVGPSSHAYLLRGEVMSVGVQSALEKLPVVHVVTNDVVRTADSAIIRADNTGCNLATIGRAIPTDSIWSMPESVHQRARRRIDVSIYGMLMWSWLCVSLVACLYVSGHKPQIGDHGESAR